MRDRDEHIHRALAHPIRRRIISYLQENTYGSFTELLKAAGTRDHGKLGFHLKALGALIGYERSKKRYHLTSEGLLAAELLWETRFNLIETIHFTEKVTTKIHGLLDENKIYSVVKEEFEKSKRYNMSILLLTEDGSRLKIKETSISPGKIKATEKLTRLRLREYHIDLNKSSIYRQVVREGKTVQVNVRATIDELFPRPLSSLISMIFGYDKKSCILTPLKKHGKIIGVFAMSSTNLADYFIPSVKNLAQHISSAIELAEEHAKLLLAEEKLRCYSEHLEMLVEEKTRKLRASERRYRALFDAVADGLFQTDLEGNYIMVNPAFAAIFGYKPEDMLHGGVKTWETYASDKERAAYLEEIREKGGLKNKVLRFRRRDGSIGWIEVSVSPRRSENGEIIGYEGIVRDITERKKVEQALRESEERYRKLFEEALDAIFVADADTGILIDCNRAACELVGREKSELIGKHQRILHPPETIEENFSVTFKQHLNEKEGQILETQVITKNGEIKEVAIKGNLFELGGKKLIQGIFRDITERKRAEKLLNEVYENKVALGATPHLNSI